MSKKWLIAFAPGAQGKDHTRTKTNIALCCIIFVLLCVLLTPRLSRAHNAPSDWQWITCDVGQGDAHLIRASDNSAVLLDTGDAPYALDSCLDWAGIKKVEAIVLTHEHSDHYGAYTWYQRTQHPVGDLVVSPYFSNNRLTQLEKQSKYSTLHTVAQDMSLGFPLNSANQPQTKADILWPPVQPQLIPGEPESSGWTNNTSLVIRWDIAPARPKQNHLTVLTTGDLEAEAAHRIIKTHSSALPSAVLKIAHHGSRGSGTDLIVASQPQVAVIPVGSENSYGHPHLNIIKFLERERVLSKRTDQHGHIAISSHIDGLHLTTSS